MPSPGGFLGVRSLTRLGARGALFVILLVPIAVPPSAWAGATSVKGARLGATLVASDGATADVFGYAVALSGHTALVGAPGPTPAKSRAERSTRSSAGEPRGPSRRSSPLP